MLRVGNQRKYIIVKLTALNKYYLLNIKYLKTTVLQFDILL